MEGWSPRDAEAGGRLGRGGGPGLSVGLPVGLCWARAFPPPQAAHGLEGKADWITAARKPTRVGRGCAGAQGRALG